MTPESALSSADAAALAAVVGGARSVRAVASEAGVATSSAFDALRRLRRRGLVAWEPGQRGTLRPLVEVVAASR